MDKLKAYLEDGFIEHNQEKIDKDKSAPKKKSSVTDARNIELAKIYEDAAEYEEEIEAFEKELEVINTNNIKDIAAALNQEFKNEDRNYSEELRSIIEAGWINLIETGDMYTKDQLEIIKETNFSDVVEKLDSAYPDYEGDFEKGIRTILTKRWEMLISIKKEHLKEEIADIKIAGLKPSFVKRIYKQVHNLS